MSVIAPPPSPYYNGIPYNRSLFSTISIYLTQAQAGLLYLSKKTADTATGIITFTAGLITSSIDTTSLSAPFYFLDTLTTGILYIGRNCTNNIQLGPLTTTSVYCGGIDCQGSTINNAGARLTGAVSIGNAQTDGVLNIGTGASRTGALQIGNGLGATCPINIGTTTTGTIAIGGAFNTCNFGANGYSVNIGQNGNNITLGYGCTGVGSLISIGLNSVSPIFIGGGIAQNISIGAGVSSILTLGSSSSTTTINNKLYNSDIDSIGGGILNVGSACTQINMGALTLQTLYLFSSNINIGSYTNGNPTVITIGQNTAGSSITIKNPLTLSTVAPTVDTQLGFINTTTTAITTIIGAGSTVNVMSISIGVGTWLISVACSNGAANSHIMSVSINSVSATLDSQSENSITGIPAVTAIGCSTNKVVRVSSTTTYYFVVYSSVAQTIATPFMNAVRIA